MAITSRKIVPAFPSKLLSAQTSGQGGRLLGAKMAITQAGQMRRSSQSNTLGWARLAQQKQKTGKGVTSEAIKILNNKNNIIARQNIQRLKWGEDPDPLLTLNDILREDFGIVNEQPQAQQQPMMNPAQPMMNQTQGDASALLGMLRNKFINQIPQSNRGPAIRGYAEGGIVDKPEIAMVGEAGREYIVPENKLNPQMKAELDQLVGGIQTPEKIVSDKLPTLDMLVSELQNYKTADEAINDLVQLDTNLTEIGLDLMDVKGIDQFVTAFAKKFGDRAAQQLVEMAGDVREGR